MRLRGGSEIVSLHRTIAEPPVEERVRCRVSTLERTPRMQVHCVERDVDADATTLRIVKIASPVYSLHELALHDPTTN